MGFVFAQKLIVDGRCDFTAEPAWAGPADRELDFIVNYDTRLLRGFGGQVKSRLGRDSEEAE